MPLQTVQRLSRAGPRGRAREWATLGVHPLSWLLSNNQLEEVWGTLTKGTSSSRLLLSNQDKGCTPSVAHSLPLPLPPGFCSTCQLSFHERRNQNLSWKHQLVHICFSFLACKVYNSLILHTHVLQVPEKGGPEKWLQTWCYIKMCFKQI